MDCRYGATRPYLERLCVERLFIWYSEKVRENLQQRRKSRSAPDRSRDITSAEGNWGVTSAGAHDVICRYDQHPRCRFVGSLDRLVSPKHFLGAAKPEQLLRAASANVDRVDQATTGQTNRDTDCPLQQNDRRIAAQTERDDVRNQRTSWMGGGKRQSH